MRRARQRSWVVCARPKRPASYGSSCSVWLTWVANDIIEVLVASVVDIAICICLLCIDFGMRRPLSRTSQRKASGLYRPLKGRGQNFTLHRKPRFFHHRARANRSPTLLSTLLCGCSGGFARTNKIDTITTAENAQKENGPFLPSYTACDWKALLGGLPCTGNMRK